MAIRFVRASSTCVLLGANGLLNNVAGACICGWVNHASSSPVANGDLVLSVSTSGDATLSRFALGIQDSGVLYSNARTLAANPPSIRNDTTVLSNNTLYHVAVNVDFVNRLFYFYVNGTFSSTPAAGDWTAGNTENINSLASAIGSAANGTLLWMDGTLDDVRLYKRMLSANELQAIFACRGSDAIFFGLQARYLMNEKQTGYVTVGTETVRDYMGNLSGTITASCTYANSILKSRRIHQ